MVLDIKQTKKPYKPIVLLILDGWGLSPSWGGNAISMNNPPVMNELWRDYPHAILQAFKKVAGPYGKVGSSEIGHASIGTGRIVQQDLAEITQAIKKGSFFQNATILEFFDFVKKNNSTLHLIGLVSEGGIHSHLDHLFALLDAAKKEGLKKVAIDLITDGRDVEKTSALIYLDKLEKKIRELGIGSIATLIGRHYAMDRGNDWKLIETAYKLQTQGVGRKVQTAREAITDAYKQGFTDEFIPPYLISGAKEENLTVKDKDACIFFNFRADRARQLTRAYTDKKCLKQLFLFRKYRLLKIYFASLTSYHLENLPIKVIFPPAKIESSLAEILSDHGLTQLHLAESEKYAHISYFFNGGREKPFPGEKRIIIPSVKSQSDEENPQMQATKITDVLLKNIKTKAFDFMVANYANVDMMGHTGNIMATSQAISLIDKEVGKVSKAVLAVKGLLIITADHGNAEQMMQLSNLDTETMHTLNPVPFILVTADNKKHLFSSAITPTKGILAEILQSQHTLADIAPTILEMLGIAKPTEMTGSSLLRKLK